MPTSAPSLTSCEIGGLQDHVVLVHGLGRSWKAMLGLHLWLLRAGFHVTNLSYPSRQMTISEVVESCINPAIARLSVQPGARVHFVTHSLGGIIFRAWAAQRDPDFPLGRTVMLAPPNQGNEIIDHLVDRSWFRLLLGPVTQELGTRPESPIHRLSPVPPETTIVMGTRPMFHLFSHLLPGEHDGIVSVERGHVAGESAFHRVPADHTLIMWRPFVLRLVERCLKERSV